MTRPAFRPPSSGPVPQTAPSSQQDRLVRRQYVRFAFYKIDPTWRRLPPEKQADQKRELNATIQQFGRRMLLRPYSLMGTRADAELLLWQIAESLEPFQALATAIMSTRMGAYLNLTASYLSQTKRSIYEIRDNPEEDAERLVIQPSEARYLFVYPFIKTRPWYKLSLASRQGMMDEHIEVGRRYPAVKLNTTYSFGLDDQEFVVAFETDEPADFLDLVQDLRETEASLYTLRDVPLYSCINMGLDEALDALGGPPVAEPRQQRDIPREAWADVCPVAELPPGARKLAYLEGQQIAVFNVEGSLYAISNRCSHARGPLSEGELDSEACTVTCPWHYAKFDLQSGQVVDGIASAPVQAYQVEIRDGIIRVGFTAEGA
ncbi:MAG: chlorite dismutase family protein [Anaerolineae bacterium]|nr:chlorite dismutase family protein [Anaerolineae bacterium]